VTVRVDGWAQSFDIRRRSFCLLMAREGPAGKPVPLLVLRAARGVMLARGFPGQVRGDLRAKSFAWGASELIARMTSGRLA